MGIIDEAALEALIRKVVHEEARPVFVHQRTVEAVVGMAKRPYFDHVRAGDWPSWADGRLRYSRAADVIEWLEKHPVTTRTTPAAVADDADEEARTLARFGARRVAR